ncbi:MAG TPA: V-type ATP synthase subunit D [Kribbella sp.]|nr:V-type ATP synthase subunit D [Kribbella sp.]
MSGKHVTGRAGRLALSARLATSRRAVELLDRKQRALAAELERLELAAARSAEAFEDRAGTAAGWLRRSTALDGQDRLTAAVAGPGAEAAIEYDTTMGVRHPIQTAVTFADGEPAGSSALVFMIRAHREALAAAVQVAAAQRGVALLTAELSLTRQQQRALEARWIPRLEAQLAELEQRLDEVEREENLRLRWAAAHPAGEDR